MSAFLKKIADLFISKEKLFEQAVLEELESKNFLNLRKIPSKISNNQRYKIVNNLISAKKIEGLLISEHLYFFSLPNDKLTEIRNTLKTLGRIEIAPFKELWSVKISILELFFNHIEQGYLTDKNYLTKKYLTSYIVSTLNNQEEYDINTISKTTKVNLDEVFNIVTEQIRDGNLGGILKNSTTFLSSEIFNKNLQEYLEALDESLVEVDFDTIAGNLEVSVEGIEKYLIKIIESDPHSYVLYPLEKKIRFKR